MTRDHSGRKLAFVVPSLSERSAQDENVVQLLLFAAVRLEEVRSEGSDMSAAVISVGNDTSGWKGLSSFFPGEILEHISIEALTEPATPNLAIASHKPAYNLFEFLKTRTFDEVHCPDHCGLAYYPTQAKYLGLYFLDTLFAVHVTGGTIFRYETEDRLLDNIGALMDDLLERGSLERADAVYVHDRKAWEWYSDKIEVRGDARVCDLSRAEGAHSETEKTEARGKSVRSEVRAGPAPEVQGARNNETDNTPINTGNLPAIIYYGPLGSDGELPLFCDAAGRLIKEVNKQVTVYFVGGQKAMGGMDAVSYIRLRSGKWGVPVSIRRELSIADEMALLYGLRGVVVCSTRRREDLRSRLAAGSDLQVLQMEQACTGGQGAAGPGQIARTMASMLLNSPSSRCQRVPALTDLWRRGRPAPPRLSKVSSPPLPAIPPGSGPRVSVCVTHYCRPQKLRTALDSLKRQTYRNFEVIIVDDGSPGLEVRSELEAIRREIEPSGWRLLFQENRYLGAARNYGAAQASGEYLIFMDDDNVAKPDEISTLVAVALRTGAGIVTSFCDAFHTDNTLKDNAPPPMRFTPFGPDPALGIFSNCYGDANALYSRAVFRKLGGFTEDYGITHEDWELFCRASIEGVKMVCVPEPLFWYRVDRNGMFRGERTQVHKSANLRRHIRPYLNKLPYYQAKLVQLAQGLIEELPVTTVGACTRAARPKTLRAGQERLPYARVAVIMRTKDRPLLLRRAVRSVLDQTFRDWFLVIVNDGGDPEVVELVLDEAAEGLAGRVLALHNPVPLGMQTASNEGIISCDSDFIIIHDDDDSWESTFLARTVSHLDEHGWNSRAGGVVTWSLVVVEDIRADGEIEQREQFIFNDNLYNISLIDLAVENRFPPISFLFRRAVLDAVGAFDQQHGPLGDWDFHLRVLKQYDINVIPEPLARYHHRTRSTNDAYGNSVHAQSDLHQDRRINLHNSVIRRELNGDSGMSLAQLLVFGEMQKALTGEQGREFKRLHDYIWTIEERTKDIASQIYASANRKKTARGRNLVRNGDFRLWPGPAMTVKGTDGAYVYSLICPGVFIIYDERRGSYRPEQRKWTKDGSRLPFGKTYLSIKNNGHLQGGAWVNLEWNIPSALLLSGQTICISGLCRVEGIHNSVSVGGRYELGDGRQVAWPDQVSRLPADFERWSCVMTCPSIEEAEVRRGHGSRILLKLFRDRPFEFDLTDFQVEIGTAPTEFEYNTASPFRERLARIIRTVADFYKHGSRVTGKE